MARLDLSRNPNLTSPPPEVLGQGTQAVLTYLQQQKDGKRQWISKLLVVGEGGVGKTSLLRALRGERFEVQQSTTYGIEIKSLKLGFTHFIMVILFRVQFFWSKSANNLRFTPTSSTIYDANLL